MSIIKNQSQMNISVIRVVAELADSRPANLQVLQMTCLLVERIGNYRDIFTL